MGQPLQTDSAVLASEASNFESISASLQGIMGQVDSTAGSMQMHLQGMSEISANIHTGGTQYVSTDEDQGAALGQTIPDIGLSR
jgi:hypothetical protein